MTMTLMFVQNQGFINPRLFRSGSSNLDNSGFIASADNCGWPMSLACCSQEQNPWRIFCSGMKRPGPFISPEMWEKFFGNCIGQSN